MLPYLVKIENADLNQKFSFESKWWYYIMASNYLAQVVRDFERYYILIARIIEWNAKFKMQYKLDILRLNAISTYSFINKKIDIKRIYTNFNDSKDYVFKTPRECIQVIKNNFYVKQMSITNFVDITGYWGSQSRHMTEYNYFITGVKKDKND